MQTGTFVLSYERGKQQVHYPKRQGSEGLVYTHDKVLMQPFVTLVDQILAAKQQPPLIPPLLRGIEGVVLFDKGELKAADTSAMERQIDQMVYELYGLTPEEITIVEGKR